MSLLSLTAENLKCLFRKPYVIKNRVPFENTRGHIELDTSAEGTSCIFCGLCSKKCPSGAIAVTRGKKATDTEPEVPGKWEINRLSCVQCGYCVEVCPKKCLKMAGEFSAPVTEKE